MVSVCPSAITCGPELLSVLLNKELKLTGPGSLLHHFQCLYDFSFSERVAVYYNLTAYLIVLHIQYRKSQNTQAYMDMLSTCKMPQKILAKR